ncbi:hypothetical protein LJR225_000050 [Phenylobacterium sp. LjRoot225]|uniref:hypothetical protein n=1 Tax=Phenylobacterium sp. LjRoot225 TaxID=3342285 RepID=UPI003ECFC5D2
MLKSLRGVLAETSPIDPTAAFGAADCGRPGAPERRAWGQWAWAAAACLVVLVSVAPLLVVDVPAVLDYPNHLARFFILAHPDDPILAQMYAPRWALLPNLGMDVLGRALLSVVPPHVGGRILLGLSLLAPLAGAALYARAAFGRWTWWSLGAGTIAFNGIFFLGFMNFLLSLGVALAGAAAWRVCRRGQRPNIVALTGALAAFTAFFCHLFGFAYFAVLIAAEEAETLLRLRKDGQLTRRRMLSTATLLAAALGPTLALYVLSRRPTEDDGLVWCWRAKDLQWLMPFMGYDRWVTIGSAVVASGVIVLIWRRSRRAGGVALAFATLIVAFLFAPFSAAGGTFVDTRFPLMAALLLFAGLTPQLSRRAAMAVGIAFALLIVGRSAHVTTNWQGRARDLADLRTSLAYIEPGSKILPVLTDWPVKPPPRDGRVLPNVAPLDGHLGAIVVIERRAFWPLLFADPSQQPLRVKPPYDQLAQSLNPRAAPWRYLYDEPPPTLGVQPYPWLADWRAHFDYVLLVGPKAPPGRPPSGLVLVRAGEATSLYRIIRPPH